MTDLGRVPFEVWEVPPEGDTVAVHILRKSVGRKVCKVCLVGRTERGRQRQGEEAECVWERKTLNRR